METANNCANLRSLAVTVLLGGCANACEFFRAIRAAASGRKLRWREFTCARCAVRRLREHSLCSGWLRAVGN